MVDQRNIVNLCCRGSVDGSVDIDGQSVDYVWTHVNISDGQSRRKRSEQSSSILKETPYEIVYLGVIATNLQYFLRNM
ncbi:hypothetical protein M8J77_020175 [Diaphorina citri]|nr:hypothetical protein M8J77_020175 [Diaphorina citri]